MKEHFETRILRDLIYFDEAKALSMLSQFEDGLIADIEASAGKTTEKRHTGTAGIPILNTELGRTDEETQNIITRKKRHHEIVNLLETTLLEMGLGVDLNAIAAPYNLQSGDLHKVIRQYGYLRITGRVSFNDYERIKSLLDGYNAFREFTNQPSLNQYEYNSILEQLSQSKLEVSEIKGRNERFHSEQQQKKKDRKIDTAIQQQLDKGKLPTWLTVGIKNIVDMFHSNRLRLQLFPFETYLPLHVVADLDRRALVEIDAERLTRLYGSRPDIDLTLFGLVTSLPLPDDAKPQFGDRFNFPEYAKDAGAVKAFLEAFENVFEAMQGFEKLSGVTGYPVISVYPIFLYRTITPVAAK